MLKLPELLVTADFLPLDLGQMDVILEMQWLCTTGFMGVHWPTLTMTFAVGDSQITLKGDPTLTKSEVSLKVMSKSWEVEDQGFLIKFQHLEVEKDEDLFVKPEELETKELTEMIRTLLLQSGDVF